MSEGNYVVYDPRSTQVSLKIFVALFLKMGAVLRLREKRAKQWVFFLGYSPERINPGEKRVALRYSKVTSGCTKTSAHFVDQIYRKICKSGTHLAPSIRIAEAAKVIENIQRDVSHLSTSSQISCNIWIWTLIR